ncbi:MAG: hypothetical protein K9J12_00435 [Melioribacteraceae bacterium]|nr:hypothetical protein [Melioribacteraceae bacterium]MCF8265437.1 hypothetical protein [Melioribacteraceae bacterium]MCF8413661.1 hypothetical protein [Melioribacteraceae bacterium]MCF8431899.1 hypothetical protein [Melioribacteraceae bacterium]
MNKANFDRCHGLRIHFRTKYHDKKLGKIKRVNMYGLGRIVSIHYTTNETYDYSVYPLKDNYSEGEDHSLPLNPSQTFLQFC